MKPHLRKCMAGGLGLIFAVGLILFAHFLNLPIGCIWKKLLHIPCPGCGLTRSVVLAWQMHFWEATAMNLLFLPLLLGFGAYLVCLGLDIFTDRQTVKAYFRLLGSKPVIVLAAVLMLGSWVYNLIRDI